MIIGVSVKLALERNSQYRADRGLPEGFGSWSPKVSESLPETKAESVNLCEARPVGIY
jgi:hypothetical protein